MSNLAKITKFTDEFYPYINFENMRKSRQIKGSDLADSYKRGWELAIIRMEIFANKTMILNGSQYHLEDIKLKATNDVCFSKNQIISI